MSTSAMKVVYTTFYPLLVTFCVAQQLSLSTVRDVNLLPENRFHLEFSWSHINFTWPSREDYERAVENCDYVPENIVPTGMKVYDSILYLSMPKFKNGVPVTLAYIDMKTASKENELLTPFPDWNTNLASSCANLQSVQSMEIDTNGIMWILDGMRTGNSSDCPAKLMFFDLKYKIHLDSYTFPNEIALRIGGFLNDLVIDETDGGFAYITDNSNIDPGLVVYSRKRNRSWKLRDRTMFPELWAANFYVNDVRFEALAPIDGIALSPKPSVESKNRTVFYTALTGLDLFAISTTILRDEEVCSGDLWRSLVKFVGEKQGQCDGMMMDSRGNLFYTLLPLYGVGKWNTKERFNTSEVIDLNTDMVWPDGFAMDQKGYLYLLSNHAYKYANKEKPLTLTSDIEFRVFRLHTGTRSYLYNDYEYYHY